jgi:hypothetical protein
MHTQKHRALFAAAMALFMALSPALSSAKSEDISAALPEKDGVYSIQGRSDLKLKVIVHHAKNDDALALSQKAALTPQVVCTSKAATDLNSTTAVDKAGWKLPSSWTYRINAQSVPATIGSTKAVTLIGNSFATWKATLGSKVNFSRGTNTSVSTARYDGQNIISWAQASSGTLAITYTWYYPSTGIAAEIDTIINNKYPWYWSNPSGWGTGRICAYQGVYDAQDILTHELGHSVGLNDEYDSASYGYSTMYGYGSTGETKKDTLTTGDILGVKSVYGL